ncbi:MAG: bifunctional metallophosphatase/5'-nucleotidase [Lachnospiraceae bacterium]|nr:bifunctional metallophosphatase/5'-nucleotidase [Lachnospiraceae bacterium]
MKKLRRLVSLVLVALALVTNLSACAGGSEQKGEDIVVLFTNDVHCAIEDNITLAGVAYYKKLMEEKSKYVTLVDCGDAVQGSYLGCISRGEVLIKAMNAVGYDFAILGNHEFDYATERLKELMDMAEFKYINSNITYTGSGSNALAKAEPYTIVEYGKTKVAYLGVTTPWTISSSTPAYFMEDGVYVYDFAAGNEGKDLYAKVQGYVDEVRAKGADYVVCLAHLGTEEGTSPYMSTDLIANTTGIDVVLDGHSHSVFEMYNVENKDGKNVICAQTGTKLENLGMLVIGEGGVITVSNINDIKKQDEEALASVNGLLSQYQEMLNTVVAHSNVALSTSDENGIRAVRNRETAIGDLVADAYREVFKTDIAYVNGGGVRADLPEGDITYSDIISVNPFGNMICVVEVTGAEILDMLEYFVSKAQSETVDLEAGKALGESGSFPCMSGIKFTVNTTIPSPAVVDENDNLLYVEGERRVSDVTILQDGKYVPIDTAKTYTLASHNYLIQNGGNGMMFFLAFHNILVDCGMADYQAVITYLTDFLKGDLSGYTNLENRITFIR